MRIVSTLFIRELFSTSVYLACRTTSTSIMLVAKVWRKFYGITSSLS